MGLRCAPLAGGLLRKIIGSDTRPERRLGMDDEWAKYIADHVRNEMAKQLAWARCVGLPSIDVPELDQYFVGSGTSQYFDRLWLQEIGIRA